MFNHHNLEGTHIWSFDEHDIVHFENYEESGYGLDLDFQTISL